MIRQYCHYEVDEDKSDPENTGEGGGGILMVGRSREDGVGGCPVFEYSEAIIIIHHYSLYRLSKWGVQRR